MVRLLSSLQNLHEYNDNQTYPRYRNIATDIPAQDQGSWLAPSPTSHGHSRLPNTHTRHSSRRISQVREGWPALYLLARGQYLFCALYSRVPLIDTPLSLSSVFDFVSTSNCARTLGLWGGICPWGRCVSPNGSMT